MKFMFPTLSQISLKSFGKVLFFFFFFFFKCWSRNYFHETKIRFLAAILKRNIFFECSFCWIMVVLGEYRYGASFVKKFLRKST